MRSVLKYVLKGELFAATETAAVSAHTFFLIAIAQKEDYDNGQKCAARAYLVDYAVYTAAAAAAYHEQYYEQIKIVIVIA